MATGCLYLAPSCLPCLTFCLPLYLSVCLLAWFFAYLIAFLHFLTLLFLFSFFCLTSCYYFPLSCFFFSFVSAYREKATFLCLVMAFVVCLPLCSASILSVNLCFFFFIICTCEHFLTVLPICFLLRDSFFLSLSLVSFFYLLFFNFTSLYYFFGFLSFLCLPVFLSLLACLSNSLLILTLLFSSVWWCLAFSVFPYSSFGFLSALRVCMYLLSLSLPSPPTHVLTGARGWAIR